MILNIKGKDTELKFDIGFIRRLDQKHSANISQVGVSFGAGLMVANVQLSQYSPVILSDIIVCASKGIKQADVDEAIETYAEEHGDLDGLFKEIKDEMGKSPVIKATLTNLKKQARQANQGT